jgi:hypothetical protein
MRSFQVFAALLITVFIISAVPADAAGLRGTWAGGGYIHPRAGNRERVRCVERYQQEAAKVFGVRATCASSAGSICAKMTARPPIGLTSRKWW